MFLAGLSCSPVTIPFPFAAISDLASKYQHMLCPDENADYDELIEINLSEVTSFSFKTSHILCQRGNSRHWTKRRLYNIFSETHQVNGTNYVLFKFILMYVLLSS